MRLKLQTSYLRYMVEIERTRSITQAASNLFLTQPSLSRILHETENQLGYAIFERTNRGVRPTEAGTAFLRHAKRVLSEMEAIEGLGSGKRPPDRFRLCMPRSAGILEMTVDYLNTLPADHPLDAMLRECHVRQAFDYLTSGEVDLGIIRFRAEYQDFFEAQALDQKLGFRPLNRYRYRVIFRRDNPLACKPMIREADLAGMTEITHGDTFRNNHPSDRAVRHVYSVDRHAQLTLLFRLPNAFMWVTSMRQEVLEAWGLVQRSVEDNQIIYQNALVHIAPELLNDIERSFMDYVIERCRN